MENTARTDGYDRYLDEVIISATESLLSVDPATIPASELQQSFRRLVLLFGLGHQIYAETDESRVFETILSTIPSLLRAERAFVATLSQGKLFPRATHQIALSED